MKEKENWEEEKKAIEEDKASTELAREHDKIRLMEFEVLFLPNSAILFSASSFYIYRYTKCKDLTPNSTCR